MIAKCTHAVNSLRLSLLFTVFSLPACVDGAQLSTECLTIIIASVLGTLLACTAVTIGLLFYVRRRARDNAMRESRRKMVAEDNEDALHFRNEMTQGPDEPDSGGERASPLGRASADRETQHQKTPSALKCHVSDMGTQTNECHIAKPKHQLAVLEKRQDGEAGLELAIAGLFVKTVCSDLILRSGCCVEPGDEILSINGQQVDGMSDVEAVGLLAKSGPTVLLEVVKNSFIDKIQNRRDPCQCLDMKKRARVSSPQPTISSKAAWKKARIEMDEALTELRRSATMSPGSVPRPPENSSPSQSLTSSVELQYPIVEEDFVVIESEAINNLQSKIDRITVPEVAKGDEQAKERHKNCDENENFVPWRTRSRSDLGVALANVTCKASPVDRKAEVQVREMHNHYTKRTEATAGGGSLSTSSGCSDLQQARKDLHLSLNAVSYPTRKSPIGDRTKLFANTPPSESSPMPVEASAREHLASSSNRHSLHLSDNGAITSAQYSNAPPSTVAPSYDLDKIKPPPSYEVASQIFNSQKPSGKLSLNDVSLDSEGHRSDSMESQLSYQSLLNGFSSQHSSFDEVESILPTIMSKSGREQVAIDEHVMRYMTKKYSEPRMSTQVTRSATSVSHPGNAARLSTMSIPASGAYRRSPVPSIERSVSIPSMYSADRKGAHDEFHTSTGQQSILRSSSVSQIATTTSPGQPLIFTEVSEMAMKTHGSEAANHVTPLISWNSDGLPVAVNGVGRKRSPDRNADLAIQRELSGIAPGSAAMGQPRKASQANRLSRLYRQKGFSTENIRRAASSPSVNSDHLRSSSVESQNEAGSGPSRAKSKQNGHSATDESFDRRKSIDSGSLRKLAAELQANQSLSDDLPMISRLLGGTKFQEFDKQNNLYRYKSSDTLYGRF